MSLYVLRFDGSGLPIRWYLQKLGAFRMKHET